MKELMFKTSNFARSWTQ